MLLPTRGKLEYALGCAGNDLRMQFVSSEHDNMSTEGNAIREQYGVQFMCPCNPPYLWHREPGEQPLKVRAGYELVEPPAHLTLGCARWANEQDVLSAASSEHQ